MKRFLDNYFGESDLAVALVTLDRSRAMRCTNDRTFLMSEAEAFAGADVGGQFRRDVTRDDTRREQVESLRSGRSPTNPSWSYESDPPENIRGDRSGAEMLGVAVLRGNAGVAPPSSGQFDRDLAGSNRRPAQTCPESGRG